MASLLRGVLARGIRSQAAHQFILNAAQNFSGAPVANAVSVQYQLFRGVLAPGIGGRSARLNATRDFSGAPVANAASAQSQLSRRVLAPGIRGGSAHHHKLQFLNSRNFSNVPVANNATTLSQLLLRGGNRGQAVAHHHNQFLNARFSSSTSVGNNTYPGLRGLKPRFDPPTTCQVSASARSCMQSFLKCTELKSRALDYWIFLCVIFSVDSILVIIVARKKKNSINNHT